MVPLRHRKAFVQGVGEPLDRSGCCIRRPASSSATELQGVVGRTAIDHDQFRVARPCWPQHRGLIASSNRGLRIQAGHHDRAERLVCSCVEPVWARKPGMLNEKSRLKAGWRCEPTLLIKFVPTLDSTGCCRGCSTRCAAKTSAGWSVLLHRNGAERARGLASVLDSALPSDARFRWQPQDPAEPGILRGI